MPVLEARACGTTVVTSDVPELHEAGGNDAIYVNPTAKGIEQGIVMALSTCHSEIDESSFPTWELGARTLAGVLKG